MEGACRFVADARKEQVRGVAVPLLLLRLLLLMMMVSCVSNGDGDGDDDGCFQIRLCRSKAGQLW